MAIKSKELASMLGVSTATMSLVLNNKPGISDELRFTLLERIRELGYGYMIKTLPEGEEIPSLAAVRNIAYVVLSPYREEADEAAFFPAVIEGAEREARHRGFHLSIIHMYGEKERSLRECIGSDQYAGMLVYADRLDRERKEELDELQLPYVMVGCVGPDVCADCVTVNNRQGMYAAVRYLYEKGHRQIGYVSSGRNSSSLQEREQCCRFALEELGLEVREDFFYRAEGSSQNKQRMLEEIWKKADCLPTALLLENDVMAVPVYRALKKIGICVPKDMSVIGFDGRSMCSMLEPTLTTMRVPRRVLGRMLVMQLENKMDLKTRSLENSPVRLEVAAELVEMESVAEPVFGALKKSL